MIVSRSTFLDLADEKLPRFQALQRRNQVPTWTENRKESDYQDRRGYLPFEAVLLRVADMLADHLPYDRENIAELVGYHGTDALALIFDFRAGKRVGVRVACLDGYPMFTFGATDELNASAAQDHEERDDHVKWSAQIDLTDEIAGIAERAEKLGVKLLPADE
ncbi:MAG: hypothetical protein P1U84_17565 [Parvibaculaceae bacterium]|nr:hypothetical protein [Parvibaculaceae bacterium]